jgi:hypothetical protein
MVGLWVASGRCRVPLRDHRVASRGRLRLLQPACPSDGGAGHRARAVRRHTPETPASTSNQPQSRSICCCSCVHAVSIRFRSLTTVGRAGSRLSALIPATVPLSASRALSSSVIWLLHSLLALVLSAARLVRTSSSAVWIPALPAARGSSWSSLAIDAFSAAACRSRSRYNDDKGSARRSRGSNRWPRTACVHRVDGDQRSGLSTICPTPRSGPAGRGGNCQPTSAVADGVFGSCGSAEKR